ncbi:alpha-1,6-glucosidase domain-containing protein [Bowmanella sp. JS7-9]|uniref:Alpha-1,6-glucosidase domain-containing protein n=1 Tax=Pseudobowmanella zhangzhouensis TaxID=1537679 RepID=A0ABW1XN76_9ALTE|nr:alpha-1,6-glucosidase domain-containing protein [Bowmanella sp. JS7-9]TBX20394.1 pullulanase [Bowmanella sp. JS7-9]
MFTLLKLRTLLIAMLTSLMLVGCGGADIESGNNDLLVCSVPNVPNSAGTACEPPPPIDCPAPTIPNATNDACEIGLDPNAEAPVVFAARDQAVLFYNRIHAGATNTPGDTAYDGWMLHTWNNEACDAYEASAIAPSWQNGVAISGIDPVYGAYWVLDLKAGYAETEGACGNFIIHKGDEKEMNGIDAKMPLKQLAAKSSAADGWTEEDFYRMNWVLNGSPELFAFPIPSLGEQAVKVEGAAAHWIDVNTFLWDIPDGVSSVKMHYAADASLKVTLEDGLNGTAVALSAVDLSEAQAARTSHLQNMQAFAGEWELDAAKAVFKSQVVLAGYNADDELVAATNVQMPLALDAVYTAGEADADEASLGPVYNEDGSVTAALWAPTAQSVTLKVYNADKTLNASHTMTEDSASGIWSYTGSDVDRAWYRYEITVYHPASGKLETLEVTDPYSVSLSTNSRFSQFVNLADEDLKPAGWDEQTIPTIANPEDAVIYEGHIRDFSAMDSSTTQANRGKYLAFTEADSAPVMHLQKLADAGVTHFHMLPSNDIASIEEDASQAVNLSSTVSVLCRLNRNAQICDDGSVNRSTTLGDLLASYDPVSEGGKAQALVNDMRGVDQFNWGYDPYHFNAPEGSYSSDPDGVARITEMRAMNMALHDIGLRVVMDVVYNHTNASGLNGKSVLDKVVPGYYHRYDTETGAILRETCCDDTEPRNRMMEKLMHDSLLLWTTEYKVDGFRFDIMSHASKDTMLALREAVQAVDADNYFYGEGWTRTDRGYQQANQLELAGSEIGTFNDRYRDAVRGGQLFHTDSDGMLAAQDKIKMGLAGTLKDYVLVTSGGSTSTTQSLGGYAEDPADIINYVSKHDDETLWDKLQYNLPADMTLAQRVRAQNIAASLPLMAQGIPFLQMGGDFLRSKSMDRNTYDAGDWFNKVDFTLMDNNWNKGLPLAQDNQGNWSTIAAYMTDPDRAATPDDMQLASAVFDEFLSIRATSPLFRLTTAQDIMDRVGFHNLGENQTKGLIVMSIDDGTGLTDLDSQVDALVVVVNATEQEQSHRILTATGFELHATQAASADVVVHGATFSEGEGDDAGNGSFTVPALSMAVFVKPQMGEQGAGLSAFATAGAPDVVPYGDNVIYVKGSMNGWSNNDPMSYIGGGVYELTLSLNGGETYEFKIADANWGPVANFGSDSGTVTLGDDKVLSYNAGNLSITPAESGDYVFRVNAFDPAAPVLNVKNDNPYPGTTVYLRGDMNGWGTTDAFTFIGGGQYEVVVTLAAGTYQFKVANDGWNTVNFGSNDGALEPGTVDKALEYNAGNLSITITEEADYRFVFNAHNAGQETLSVGKSALFGDTVVYIRGSLNGWGTDDPLLLTSPGTYSVTKSLTAGSYEFKFASEDWSTRNIGAAETANVEVGSALPLAHGANPGNLVIDIAVDGDYQFSLSGFNPDTPTLLVTEVSVP